MADTRTHRAVYNMHCCHGGQRRPWQEGSDTEDYIQRMTAAGGLRLGRGGGAAQPHTLNHSTHILTKLKQTQLVERWVVAVVQLLQT